MPTLVTVSQPANNEILVSSAYLQNKADIDRIGAATKTRLLDTTIGVDSDIFFKFYTCNDSTGSKVYSALDVSSAISNATIENRFLSLLFTQYSNDATFVADLGGAMVDISERMNNTALTNNLAATLTMPTAASNPNYLEYVDMGLKSYFGAAYVNGDNTITNTRSSLRGTRVGQVHLTSIDPLSSPIEAKYDNSTTGCWQFSDYGVEGIIVYTNLFSQNATKGGLSIWSQFLCVHPILASVYDADYACIFNDLDSSFLQSGLGYFDRNARAAGNPNFYGWSGNFLLSIFNDWGIPIVCPIWGVPRLAIHAFFGDGNIRDTTNFEGAINTTDKRFVSIEVSNAYNAGYLQNVNGGFLNMYNDRAISGFDLTKKAINPFCYLWANECQYGSAGVGSAVPDYQSYMSRQGFNSNPWLYFYFTAPISVFNGPLDVTQPFAGYDSHNYKYILENDKGIGSFTPSFTRGLINIGADVSALGSSYFQDWLDRLATRPTLSRVFVTFQGKGTFYGAAATDFYATNSYDTDLNTRLADLTVNVSTGLDAMDATAVSRLQNWLW
jgi:hypothetical protein